MLCHLRCSTLQTSNLLRAAPVVLQCTVIANRLQAGFWLKAPSTPRGSLVARKQSEIFFPCSLRCRLILLLSFGVCSCRKCWYKIPGCQPCFSHSSLFPGTCFLYKSLSKILHHIWYPKSHKCYKSAITVLLLLLLWLERASLLWLFFWKHTKPPWVVGM